MSFIYDMSDSWNNAGTTFTAIKMNVTNTASAAGSRLIDLQIGGTSLFYVDKNGALKVTNSAGGEAVLITGNSNTASIQQNGSGLYFNTNSNTTGGDFVWRNSSSFTERMRLTSDGNLAIGQSSAASTSGKNITIGGVEPVLALNSSASSREFRIAAGGNFAYIPNCLSFIDHTAGATRMLIDSAGNVGIGVIPSHRLDVASAANTASAYTALFRSTGAAGYSGLVGLGVNPTAAGAYTAAAFGAENVNGTANDGGILKFLTATADASHTLTERMRLDNNGNLGLGMTPSAWLSASKAMQLGASGVIEGRSGVEVFQLGSNWYLNSGGTYTYTTTGNASRYTTASGSHQWFTASSGTAGNAITFTQAMTLDANGNLGLGATTISALGSGYTTQAISGTNGSGIRLYTGATEYGRWYADGSVGMVVQAVGATTPTVFYTNATERARITAAGELLVGTSTAQGGLATDAVGVTLYGGTAKGTSVFTRDSVNPVMYINNKTSAGGLVQFYNGGNNVGSITSNGTGVTYGTASDARLKENIADADDAASLIDAIQVRKFDWKVDGLHQRYGMVAQELLEVAPEAVSVPADENEMMGVDYSKLVPMLIKEVQSLRARVAQLEGN